jgi:hypothetical protein
MRVRLESVSRVTYPDLKKRAVAPYSFADIEVIRVKFHCGLSDRFEMTFDDPEEARLFQDAPIGRAFDLTFTPA